MHALFEELKHLAHEATKLCKAVVQYLEQPKPLRQIRLAVAEVHFIQPPHTGIIMPENLAIDLPAATGGLPGQFARLVIQPKDTSQAVAKLDGPVTAVPQASPPVATVAVGPDGLTVDIQLPDAPDSQDTVEIDGDADTDPTVKDVLTTLVTVRRLGPVVGKAVSLGVTPAQVTLLPADQFGQFGTTPPLGGARRR